MFNITQHIEALKQSMIGYILMLAAAIIGLIWISVGVYSWATQLLGPTWGPIAIGGVFILPVLIYVVVKALMPHDKRSKQQRMFDEAFASSPIGALSKMIETMSPHSPFLAAITAVAGGFVATRFPQFLQIMAELVGALGEELTRWNSRKAEKETKKATDYERRGTPPPPPDVEPVARRRKKAAGDY